MLHTVFYLDLVLPHQVLFALFLYQKRQIECIYMYVHHTVLKITLYYLIGLTIMVQLQLH